MRNSTLSAARGSGKSPSECTWCNKCGSSLPSKPEFCRSCGAKVDYEKSIRDPTTIPLALAQQKRDQMKLSWEIPLEPRLEQMKIPLEHTNIPSEHTNVPLEHMTMPAVARTYSTELFIEESHCHDHNLEGQLNELEKTLHNL